MYLLPYRVFLLVSPVLAAAWTNRDENVCQTVPIARVLADQTPPGCFRFSFLLAAAVLQVFRMLLVPLCSVALNERFGPANLYVHVQRPHVEKPVFGLHPFELESFRQLSRRLPGIS
jgi:hypothetical protein